MDYIQRALSGDGMVRAAAAITTDMAEKAREIHGLSKPVTAAMGRTLTLSALMGCQMKGDSDSLTLMIDGGGPAGRITAVANSEAEVKGYVTNPEAEAEPKNGKLNVGGVVGTDGFLTVIRDFGLKEPYVGKVRLVSGEIGDDAAAYFAQSEQVPSIVALGVLMNRDCTVKAAGGLIVQAMPGADNECIEKLEKFVAELPPVTTLISGGATPEDMINAALSPFGSYTMQRFETSYKCDCSKERIERALISLGKDELSDIIKEQGKAEMTCRFCNKKYTVDKERLTELLKSIS